MLNEPDEEEGDLSICFNSTPSEWSSDSAALSESEEDEEEDEFEDCSSLSPCSCL